MMKRLNLKDVPKDKFRSSLFTGEIFRQTPFSEIQDTDLSVNYIHFPKGIRNKLHSHSNDQILIVTKGSGIVATKEMTLKVKTGDIIWIPKNEIHWHGAGPSSDFTHIAITRADTTIHQVEQ